MNYLSHCAIVWSLVFYVTGTMAWGELLTVFTLLELLCPQITPSRALEISWQGREDQTYSRSGQAPNLNVQATKANLVLFLAANISKNNE